MIKMFCTRKLAERLGPLEALLSAPGPTVLGDWHATIVTLQRRPYLLAISERGRLPVIIVLMGSGTVFSRFAVEVGRMLVAVGVPLDQASEEAIGSSQIVLGRAFNRSLLGTLNDFTSMARAYMEAPDAGPLDPHDLALWLANTPIRPLEHTFPDVATRILFGV